MPLLSKLEQQNNINIAGIALPELKTDVGWRPEKYITPHVWDVVIGEIARYTRENNADSAFYLAGVMATLFPEKTHDLPVTLEQFGAHVRATLERGIGKSMGSIAFIDFLEKARPLFPREVTNVFSDFPALATETRNSILKMEDGRAGSLADLQAWMEIATWTVATGSRFPTHKCAHSINPLINWVLNLQHAKWWQDGGTYRDYLNSILSIVLYPTAFNVKTFRPPAEAWSYIDSYLKRVEKQDIDTYVYSVLRLTLIMSDKVTFGEQGLSYLLPSAEAVEDQQTQPPPQRSF